MISIRVRRFLMSGRYATGGLLRKYSAFVSDYGDLNFGGCKNYSRKYSCSMFRKSSNPVRREVNKRAKKEDKQNVDPKVFTRDIVREISNILRYSSWESAQRQLQLFQVKWDSYTVNQVLKTHPPMEKAWLFFNWVSKVKGFKHDQYTHTTMLDIFGEARRIDSMKYILQMMHEKGIKINTVTYTSVLHWLSKSGDFDGAIKVWEEMKAKHCYPTVVSYTAYMKVLFDNNKSEEATEVYKEMLQSGLSPTCHTYTILMVHLISSGKCKTAIKVFTNLQETGVQPDKAMCNIMVEQCCKVEEVWAIVEILRYMKENFLVLRYPIYLKAHDTLKKAGQDDTLLRQVNPHIKVDVFDETVTSELEETVSDVNSVIDRGLLSVFLKKNNLLATDRLFAGMVSNNKLLDSELVSDFIEVNCDHDRTNSALMAFDYSKNTGIHIEQVAYLSLIGTLIRTKELSKILEIVKEMVKFKSFLEPAFAASLIYSLGQVRELDLAVSIFNMLPKETKTLSAYTALIDACFSAGFPGKGLETFNAMEREGIQGTSSTYNVLIRGFEMCGRDDKAIFYRREKRGLERKNNVSNIVLVEEKICDALFAGYMVS